MHERDRDHAELGDHRFRRPGLLLAVCCVVLVPSAALRSQPAGPPVPGGPTTQLVLLGTGTPNADPERSGPSVAIIVRGTPYIVDFGPGVVRRAAAAQKKGVTGLEPPKLKHAFVTHLHSDHTAGYPDLILTPWVLGRDEPLEVYGPPGIAAMTEHILKAYEQDIDMRVHGLEHANDRGWRVNAHEVQPGVVYKDDNVTVKAFAVKHGSWTYAFGYRFETPDRTIVISGDCTRSPSVAEACNGCDILVHEVYCQAGFDKRPPGWQKYHSEFHTSSGDLATIATQARPGLLVLYHQLIWDSTEEVLLDEIRRGYSGKVVSGHDLDLF